MLRLALWLLGSVIVWDVASFSITCPDGSVCPDTATCCLTHQGYRCCPYPNAVCCTDLAHCCPSGFRCNLSTQMCEKQSQAWVSAPMARKDAPEQLSNPVAPVSPQMSRQLHSSHVPEPKKSSVVFCDNYHACPDGTTCCMNPQGFWFCCPYSPARCCPGTSLCCPLGLDCDITHTHCVRPDLRYAFTPRQSLSSFPASPITAVGRQRPFKGGGTCQTPLTALKEATAGDHEVGVIRCDSKFFCPQGSTCCKTSAGQWSCCPYPLGKCCADGKHCCEYGYTCDPSSLTCRRWYSQVPSGRQEHAKADPLPK